MSKNDGSLIIWLQIIIWISIFQNLLHQSNKNRSANLMLLWLSKDQALWVSMKNISTHKRLWRIFFSENLDKAAIPHFCCLSVFIYGILCFGHGYVKNHLSDAYRNTFPGFPFPESYILLLSYCCCGKPSFSIAWFPAASANHHQEQNLTGHRYGP